MRASRQGEQVLAGASADYLQPKDQAPRPCHQRPADPVLTLHVRRRFLLKSAMCEGSLQLSCVFLGGSEERRLAEEVEE